MLTRTLSLIVISLVCLVTGCDPGINVQLPAFIDASSLSENDARLMLEASDEWYVATDGAADMQSSQPDVGGLIKAEYVDRSDTQGYTWLSPLSETVHVGLDLKGEDVTLATYGTRFTRDQIVRTTFLHELGHAMGLLHQPGTLMDVNRNQEYGQCIDAATLRQFCTLHHCGPGAHSTCP